MKLVIATNNLNKLKEIRALMPKHIQLLSLNNIGCFEDIPETKDTIEGNAIEKAAYIKNKYGYNCFSDDTGLEVEALHGAPGVYSARYAGEQRDAYDNNEKLLNELALEFNRKAQFKTVICLQIDNEMHLFEGICKGEITTKKHGDKGFGYDPVFKPTGYNITFAEMDLALKNRIGHRGKAISKLITFLNT